MGWFEAPAVRALAQELIEAYHPRLDGERIEYAFVDGKLTEHGRRVWARASVIRGKNAWLARHDAEDTAPAFFMIEVEQEAWLAAGEASDKAQQWRMPMIDQALARCDYTEAGEPCLKPFDVSDFAAVVGRWGAWRGELKLFFEANAARQPPLPLDDDSGSWNQPAVTVGTGTTGMIADAHLGG